MLWYRVWMSTLYKVQIHHRLQCYKNTSHNFRVFLQHYKGAKLHFIKCGHWHQLLLFLFYFWESHSHLCLIVKESSRSKNDGLKNSEGLVCLPSGPVRGRGWWRWVCLQVRKKIRKRERERVYVCICVAVLFMLPSRTILCRYVAADWVHRPVSPLPSLSLSLSLPFHLIYFLQFVAEIIEQNRGKKRNNNSICKSNK